MIYNRDKKLKKRFHVLKADLITIKHWFDIFSSNDAFLPDVFQITTIVLVSVKNHYHIDGLHLFWDTLYICLGLFLFYGLSTVVGYLMPNPFFMNRNSSILNNSV